MATKEIIMLDEGEEVKEDIKTVAVVLSENCVIKGNVVIMPIDEALSISANIAIQVAMLL